jgi:hypothetical protein
MNDRWDSWGCWITFGSILMFPMYVIILCAFVGWRGPQRRGSQELDS